MLPAAVVDAGGAQCHTLQVAIPTNDEPDAPIGLAVRGLHVAYITRNSAAAEAGLRANDKITAVGGRSVASQEEIRCGLARWSRKTPLRVEVLQSVDSKPKFVEPASAFDWQQAVSRQLPTVSETSDLFEENRSTASGSGYVSEGDEPRGHIILNCEDIGRCAKSCPVLRSEGQDSLGSGSGGGGNSGRDKAIDCEIQWRALAQIFKYYEERGYTCQGVCRQNRVHVHPPPPDLARRLVPCQDDQLFVLRLSETYGCSFVDNSNYRKEDLWDQIAPDMWDWLQSEGAARKIEYIFDSYGQFVPLRTPSSQ